MSKYYLKFLAKHRYGVYATDYQWPPPGEWAEIPEDRELKRCYVGFHLASVQNNFLWMGEAENVRLWLVEAEDGDDTIYCKDKVVVRKARLVRKLKIADFNMLHDSVVDRYLSAVGYEPHQINLVLALIRHIREHDAGWSLAYQLTPLLRSGIKADAVWGDVTAFMADADCDQFTMLANAVSRIRRNLPRKQCDEFNVWLNSAFTSALNLTDEERAKLVVQYDQVTESPYF